MCYRRDTKSKTKNSKCRNFLWFTTDTVWLLGN